MTIENIKVPDIGGGEGVEVIEICVAVIVLFGNKTASSFGQYLTDLMKRLVGFIVHLHS